MALVTRGAVSGAVHEPPLCAAGKARDFGASPVSAAGPVGVGASTSGLRDVGPEGRGFGGVSSTPADGVLAISGRGVFQTRPYTGSGERAGSQSLLQDALWAGGEGVSLGPSCPGA
jgi:hypothetical protein